MKGISVEDYIQVRKKHEPTINVTRLKRDIHTAIRKKLEGYTCRQCESELWAVGMVITEDELCYQCIQLEPKSENEIEFDVVLEKTY